MFRAGVGFNIEYIKTSPPGEELTPGGQAPPGLAPEILIPDGMNPS